MATNPDRKVFEASVIQQGLGRQTDYIDQFVPITQRIQAIAKSCHSGRPGYDSILQSFAATEYFQAGKVKDLQPKVWQYKPPTLPDMVNKKFVVGYSRLNYYETAIDTPSVKQKPFMLMLRAPGRYFKTKYDSGSSPILLRSSTIPLRYDSQQGIWARWAKGVYQGREIERRRAATGSYPYTPETGDVIENRLWQFFVDGQFTSSHSRLAGRVVTPIQFASSWGYTGGPLDPPWAPSTLPWTIADNVSYFKGGGAGIADDYNLWGPENCRGDMSIGFWGNDDPDNHIDTLHITFPQLVMRQDGAEHNKALYNTTATLIYWE